MPRQRGLRPNGSLTPINFRGLAMTSPYAPLILAAVLSIASSTVAVWTRSLAI